MTDGTNLILDVHVQPRASRDEIVGYHGDRLKIRIVAPPVDGKANQHLIAFLASVFRVPKRDVVLLAGESGRDKRLKIVRPACIPDIVRTRH
jgi:uncharacterized protein (TIGR00251 family)